jgi:hypothetical protein
MRAAVVILALPLAPALAAPQSLGDAAQKQARERSKQTVPRVYTEADLHEKGDPPASAPADLPAPPADAQAGTATRGAKQESEDAVRARLDRDAAARKTQELAWRGLARAAAARLEQAQRGYDAACGSGPVVPTGG